MPAFLHLKPHNPPIRRGCVSLQERGTALWHQQVTGQVTVHLTASPALASTFMHLQLLDGARTVHSWEL